MEIYSKFIGNFMKAKISIETAKQAKPVFAKFLEVSEWLDLCVRARVMGVHVCVKSEYMCELV